MEAMKATIHDQDTPMYILEEASRKTLYVHNIISHGTLGNKKLQKICLLEKILK